MKLSVIFGLAIVGILFVCIYVIGSGKRRRLHNKLDKLNRELEQMSRRDTGKENKKES
jgi:hypothetical protein